MRPNVLTFLGAALVLALLRLARRVGNALPALVETLPRWQQVTARLGRSGVLGQGSQRPVIHLQNIPRQAVLGERRRLEEEGIIGAERDSHAGFEQGLHLRERADARREVRLRIKHDDEGVWARLVGERRIGGAADGDRPGMVEAMARYYGMLGGVTYAELH